MSNQKAEHREQSRQLRKEMSRFTLNCSEVQITASHGNISLNGRVRPMKGHEESFESSIAAMLKALRAQRGVRDVLAEWTVIL